MRHSDQNPPVVFDFYKPKDNEIEKTINTLGIDLDKIHTSKKLQIVLLDLDLKALKVLSSLLKPYYDVHCCNSPIEALKLISTKKIALVISEQALPNQNISGAEFLKKVKKIAPLTTRILLAGVIDFGKAKYSIEPGDVFKLVKRPFDDKRMLTLISEAMELFLEQTGGLAAAAAKMHQHSPNIAKPVDVVKNISPLSNPVIVQCSDQIFFSQIKDSYPDKAFFIHAKSKEAMIKILETTVVKTLLYCFENINSLENHDTQFLEQIKHELPHLTIVAIMGKDKVNYQQIMNLLTKKVIFDYLPYNTKPEKIYQQLSAAIVLSNRLYNGPVYLVWPPIERFEPKEEEETIGEALKDMHLKVREGVLSSIATVKGLFKKK